MTEVEIKEAKNYFAMAARGDGFPSAASAKKAGETGLWLIEELERLRKEVQDLNRAGRNA
jgi:hypothetical protein